MRRIRENEDLRMIPRFPTGQRVSHLLSASLESGTGPAHRKLRSHFVPTEVPYKACHFTDVQAEARLLAPGLTPSKWMSQGLSPGYSRDGGRRKVDVGLEPGHMVQVLYSK